MSEAINYLAELFGWEIDLHNFAYDLHERFGSWDIESYASYGYLASLVDNYR